MSLIEKKLAAIYIEKKDYFILKSTAIVDYNIITNKFIIKTSNFKNMTNRDFNKIVGNDSYIYGEGQKLSFVNNNKEYSIFIFNNKFIDNEYDFNLKTSLYDIFLDMTQKLSGVLLIKNDNYLLANFDYFTYLNNSYSEKQVDCMLLDEKYIKEQQDIDEINDDNKNVNQTIMLPFGMQMIMPISNDLKEANKEESFKQEISISNSEKEYNKSIDVEKIINDINSKIVGQEKAIKTLVTNIYYNQVLIDELSKNNEIDSLELDSRKISILLDGSTGTGKTAIMKNIASKLDLPIDIVNANSFSETGYVGPTITDILSRLLSNANGDIKLAERGIIVLDEIDKIATPINYEGRDMKKGVQEELLSFIGGGKYDISIQNGIFKNTISFDTSKITFILSGAFTRLRENKIKEQEKKFNGMGFNGIQKENKKEYEITSQDYIDYGLMREFFGRIKVLTSTKSYNIEDLKRILLESKVSPLKNLEKTVQMFGYPNITYDNIFVNKICEEAYNLDTGARGLQSIMAGIQNKILIDLINKTYDLDMPIEINEDLLNEYKKDNVRTYSKTLKKTIDNN